MSTACSFCFYKFLKQKAPNLSIRKTISIFGGFDMKMAKRIRKDTFEYLKAQNFVLMLIFIACA
ncbi:hypothetical protein CH319_00195 [Mycoplasmopsis bovis]|nr:hypothetical protein CH319_00195 [Mycoplasmopsis bovis]AXJ73837.1 hypothetical protein CH315_00195 [Mycoplasmopsis bovis]